MALLVPDEGEVTLLEHMVNKVASADFKLHLFTNDYTPVEGSELADFTEAVAAGYAEITLTGADWTVATATGTTTAEHVQKTFTFTAASVDYGYYVTNNAGTKVVWAERFSDAPHNIPSGGGTEKITVKIQGE
jgi:predicted transcriptional regulator YdeE